jgi:hypothetical protein
MTKISIYNIDENVTSVDKWIGSDGNNQNRTKNFTPKKIADYFNQNEVIDISNSIRYIYDTIAVGDQRKSGTLSFKTEIGPTVPIENITTFLLSKSTQSGKDVSDYLVSLIDKTVLFQKSSSINIFGVFKITDVVVDIDEPNFFVVDLEFLYGNGSIEEDKDYSIVLVDVSSGGDPQNLQQVTDVGSTTTNSITVDSTQYFSIVEPQDVGTQNKTTGAYAFMGADGIIGISNGVAESEFRNTNVINGGIVLEFPNKLSGNYTIATTADVLAPNSPIVAATKTKITYDSKGLVTAGQDATTADIADSLNKRYVTDSQLITIGNTSGTNTGDQNLQQVTNLGSTTTNPIIIDGINEQTGLTINLAGAANGIIINTYNSEPTGYPIGILDQNSDVSFAVYHDGDVLANKFIKIGGQVTQFLKADGSVDNSVYLTSADLPSTLDLYATTTASDISGYTVLVRNISDSRFNTVAVDVSTGPITTTAQLVGSLISDANIISGNPGIFNITTIGNISRTDGTGQAEFFFRVYKRTSLGVETFITQSDNTLPVINGGYVEFSATALWNDGVFLDTDRVVLKYYANRLTSPVGSNPTYKFQFGGLNPVRSTAAIPTAVLPNIYLRDLADVENVDALNNEILYWNDADSLWEHSLAEDLVPNASATQKGLVTTGAQTFAGSKTFGSNLIIPATGSELILSVSSAGTVSGLETTYYASPFELTYLKGVTSGVQTQLNSTVKSIVNSAPNTSVTGTLTETSLISYLIPANTLPSSAGINIKLRVSKVGTAGLFNLKIRINSTNNFATSTTIAVVQPAASTLSMVMTRNPVFNAGNIYVTSTTASIVSDENVVSASDTAIAFNTAVDNYIFISAFLGSIADTLILRSVKIKN